MSVAIVPACGASRRMGRPKLILPIAGQPLIARVVTALRQGGVARVLVVVPAMDSQEGAATLAAAAQTAGAELVVVPQTPPDMRGTVECGLHRWLSASAPTGPVLITPADSPGLSLALVARVLAFAATHPEQIVVPRVQGQRGHPLVLPAEQARRILDLPRDVGINALLTEQVEHVLYLDVEDAGVLADLDTPADYHRWQDPGET